MKNVLIFLGFAVITLTSCKNNEKEESAARDIPAANSMAYQVYGEEFNINRDTLGATQMKELYMSLNVGDTAEVSFVTTVNSVCKNKGCWMKLHLPEEEEDVMVKFRNYEFFVPKDIEQREVIVKGKAYVTQLQVEEQKHYAEDQGQTREEIAAITEPKRTLAFMADGVIIRE